MYARCPNNASHLTFETTAYVGETWLVGPAGEWIETIETGPILHHPHPDNLWTCATCGAEATVLHRKEDA